MMEQQALPIVSALWFGILTSISPCPLASNIAAVTYISRGFSRTSSVVIAGAVYTLGRVITYCVLGALISSSLLNIPRVSHFLQTAMPKVLGPVLILAGLLLLGIFSFSFSGPSISEKAAHRWKDGGMPGALFIGILFSLSFCPVSAALFFGSLIPLTLKSAAPVMLPTVFGIGTGLPVLFFAFVIALGIKNLSRFFQAVSKTEVWVRRITGLLLILVGIYYIVTYIVQVQF